MHEACLARFRIAHPNGGLLGRVQFVGRHDLDADALRALVRLSHEAGRLEAAEATLATALELGFTPPDEGRYEVELTTGEGASGEAVLRVSNAAPLVRLSAMAANGVDCANLCICVWKARLSWR